MAPAQQSTSVAAGGRSRRSSLENQPQRLRARRNTITALSSDNDNMRPSQNALRWSCVPGRPLTKPTEGSSTSRRSIDQISPEPQRISSPRNAVATDLMRPAALSHDNLSEDIIKHFRINEGGAAGASPGNTEFAGLAELGISFDVKAPKVSIRRATPESGYHAVVRVTSGSPLCIEVLVDDIRHLGLTMGCVQFSRGAREVTIFATLAGGAGSEMEPGYSGGCGVPLLDGPALKAMQYRLRDMLENHHPCLGVSLMSIQLPKHATQLLLSRERTAKQAAMAGPSYRLSSAAILLLWLKGGDVRRSQMSLRTEAGAKLLSTVNQVLRTHDVQLSSGQLLMDGASGIASCSLFMHHRNRAVPVPMQRDVKAAVISALARDSQHDDVAATFSQLAATAQSMSEVL